MDSRFGPKAKVTQPNIKILSEIRLAETELIIVLSHQGFSIS